MRIDFLYGRTHGCQHAGGQAQVLVADVLRRDGHEYAPEAAIRLLAGQQIEQQEERALAAAGKRDILLADIPAVLACKQPGQRGPKALLAGRQRVIGQHPPVLGL